jgi:hypothetical protein
MSRDIAWYDWDADEEPYEAVEVRRKELCPRLTAVQLEVLWQLRVTVWDGYLISKTARDELFDLDLVDCLQGWQFITRKGMAVLDCYRLIEDDRYGTRGGTGAGDRL